jgi:hypothetical protein
MKSNLLALVLLIMGLNSKIIKLILELAFFFNLKLTLFYFGLVFNKQIRLFFLNKCFFHFNHSIKYKIYILTYSISCCNAAVKSFKSKYSSRELAP